MVLTLRGLLLLGLVATALLAGGALPASAGAAKCLTCESEGEGEVEAQILTVEIVGHGSVKNGTKTYCENASSSSKECEVELAEGKKVTLSATPLGEYVFQSWSGACSGSGSCEVTMTEAKSVTATFTNPPPAPPTITSPTAGQVFERTAEEPVSVSFTNSGDAVRFKCSVDNPAGGEICFTPWSTPKLAAGTHTVYVWAEDAEGNLSSPTTRSFEVVIAPPKTEEPPSASGGPPSTGSTGPMPVTAGPLLKLDVRLVAKWRFDDKQTIFRKLLLKRIPTGGKVVVRCVGASCPFKRKHPRVIGGVADLTASFAGRKLDPGVRIFFKATAPEMASEKFGIETRPGGHPRGLPQALAFS
jgi:List-Bact-rpt repeat protein